MEEKTGSTESRPETDSQPGISPADSPPGEPDERRALRGAIVDVLKTCYDPEIPVNIYELGLIYGVSFVDGDDSGDSSEGGDEADGESVHVLMTLTSPMCPVAGTLPPEIEQKVRATPGVHSARVEVIWDPPWNPSMMSDAAKLQLNMF